MSMVTMQSFHPLRFAVAAAVCAVCAFATTPALAASLDEELRAPLESARSDEPIGKALLAYPADPTADIAWSGGTSTVSDIQNAFNHARTVENTQLGTSIPAMTLPSQTTWDGMSNSDRAFWLSNRERIDRGVLAMHGTEANVTSVAQYYAQYLLDNDAWGHYEDGLSPWQRLEANPAIGACHDSLSVAENIAVFVTSGSSIALPVERSVYNWLYVDAGSGWGHRHAILWYPYNDNSGTAGMEGFFGIGRASGGPYQGPFSQSWPFAEMIVMNVFDPCSTWQYTLDEIFSDGFETGNTTAWNDAVP
jgi:hypothetical protein